MSKNFIFIVLLCLGLTSCDKYDFAGMIKGSSPESNERFAMSMNYNVANGYQRIYVTGEEYTFYACSDSHVAASADGLSRFVGDYIADNGAAPFAIFTGDAVDKKNNLNLFLQTVNPISANGRTLFCTPGNHDLYFGQWTDYIREMKTATYWFEVIDKTTLCSDLFISIDSASGTLGAEQRDWLESLLKSIKGQYRHIIVFTHTHFFKRDNSQGHTSNFSLEEGYDLAKLFSDNGVELVICGHDHFFEDTYFMNVHFVTLTSIEDYAKARGYHKFTVTPNGISVASFRI